MINRSILLSEIKENFFYEKSFSYEEMTEARSDYPDYEGNQMAMFFAGKSNGQINLHDLLNKYPCDHKACLFFMKIEPLSYFIGAYMYMSIVEESLGRTICVSLTNLLSCSECNEQERKHFLGLQNTYSKKQKRIIADFLAYMKMINEDILFYIDFDDAIHQWITD